MVEASEERWVKLMSKSLYPEVCLERVLEPGLDLGSEDEVDALKT